MKKRNFLMIVCGVVFILLVGGTFAFWEDEWVPTRSDGLTPGIGGAASLIKPDFRNIDKWTDAVVVGTVTEKTSGLVSCCDSIATRVAIHLPGEPGPTRMQETIMFNVEDTYKGTAPDTVTIQTERPGLGSVIRSGDDVLEPMDFQVGSRYVLFLIEREGYHQVQGYYRGMWLVEGNRASHLGEDGQLDLTELRSKVSQ